MKSDIIIANTVIGRIEPLLKATRFASVLSFRLLQRQMSHTKSKESSWKAMVSGIVYSRTYSINLADDSSTVRATPAAALSKPIIKLKAKIAMMDTR